MTGTAQDCEVWHIPFPRRRAYLETVSGDASSAQWGRLPAGGEGGRQSGSSTAAATAASARLSVNLAESARAMSLAEVASQIFDVSSSRWGAGTWGGEGTVWRGVQKGTSGIEATCHTCGLEQMQLQFVR